MERHPSYIHESLLGYFKQEDLHQYPDMWKTYEVLSQYLGVKEDKLLITRGVEGSIKQVFDTLNLSGRSVGIVSNTFAMYYVYAKAHDVDIIEIKGTEPEYKIEIEDLKKVLFTDLAVTNDSKEKAEKISKIAFRLQSCLDLENDNEIAEQLNWLYRFIRYMSKRIQDNEDMNYVQPAFKVASELKEAWDGIPEEYRNN